jgi:hypothetical protein
MDKFHTPAAIRAEPVDAPVNALGIRRTMFAIDDIESVLDGIRRHGAELVGEVAQYEGQYRLCRSAAPRASSSALSSNSADDRSSAGPALRSREEA